MTLGVIPGWEYTIWTIEFMATGLVSEGFLVDLPGRFLLVLHGILWDFQNRQASQEGSLLPSEILGDYDPLG